MKTRSAVKCEREHSNIGASAVSRKIQFDEPKTPFRKAKARNPYSVIGKPVSPPTKKTPIRKKPVKSPRTKKRPARSSRKPRMSRPCVMKTPRRSKLAATPSPVPTEVIKTPSLEKATRVVAFTTPPQVVVKTPRQYINFPGTPSSRKTKTTSPSPETNRSPGPDQIWKRNGTKTFPNKKEATPSQRTTTPNQEEPRKVATVGVIEQQCSPAVTVVSSSSFGAEFRKSAVLSPPVFSPSSLVLSPSVFSPPPQDEARPSGTPMKALQQLLEDLKSPQTKINKTNASRTLAATASTISATTALFSSPRIYQKHHFLASPVDACSLGTFSYKILASEHSPATTVGGDSPLQMYVSFRTGKEALSSISAQPSDGNLNADESILSSPTNLTAAKETSHDSECDIEQIDAELGDLSLEDQSF